MSSASIHGYIMFAVAGIEVLLAFFLMTKYQKNPIAFWYSFFVWGVIGYVGANAVTYVNFGAPLFFHLLQWFSGVVATAAFFMFALHFPIRTSRPGAYEWVLFVFPVALFFFLIFFSGNFITGLSQKFLPDQQIYGKTAMSFAVFFAFYWLLSIIHLVRKYYSSDGIHRWQLRTLLLGAVAGPLALSSIFDVYLPLSGHYGYGWIGPETSIIWLGFTSYIILKK